MYNLKLFVDSRIQNLELKKKLFHVIQFKIKKKYFRLYNPKYENCIINYIIKKDISKILKKYKVQVKVMLCKKYNPITHSWNNNNRLL